MASEPVLENEFYASAKTLGKLFQSLNIFTKKEHLKLFSFVGNGLSLWRCLAL